MKEQSFTLIELIIVITIMVLFSGLTLVNYQKINAEKNVEKEEKQLFNSFYLAREKAAQDEMVKCLTASQLYGYKVTVNTGNYRIDECCNATTCYPIYNHSFPTSITSTVSSSIVFYPYNQGTSVTNPEIYKIKTSQTTSNNCLPIIIYPSGVIDEGAWQSC